MSRTLRFRGRGLRCLVDSHRWARRIGRRSRKLGILVGANISGHVESTGKWVITQYELHDISAGIVDDRRSII